MRRILCLHLPNWPIQRLAAAKPELDARKALVLHHRDARRGQLVAHCNAAAAQRGVRIGMPLAEATTLAPGVVFPADDAADLAALAKLAEQCEQFSPLVGWKTVNGPELVPGHLFLDVTGTSVLFGGEAELTRAAIGELARLGYRARAAIADTCGAAWAQAIYSEPLPVDSLRLPGQTVQLLAQLGVTQIEQLRRLPRTSLPARFGEVLLLRLDQFQGTAAETIVPHRPPPEFVVERALEFPAENRALVEKIVRELIERLAAALAEQRKGAVQLSCRFAARPPLVVRVGLYRPSANPEHLWDLLRIQLERSLPPAIDRITLAASLVAPLQNHQQALFGASEQEGSRQLALLIDRLSGRLGPAAVLRPQLTADPLPERVVKYVPLLESRKQPAKSPAAQRPLLLRSPPVALAVLSVVPDGPPISFQFARQDHRVARWWGPERIESGWWRGPSVRRDYYRVETQEGLRYWLFRRLADGAWYLHGEFA